MPFSPRELPAQLREDLAHFLGTNDFIELYSSYSWKNDTLLNGFPDIMGLEIQLTNNARLHGITLADVRAVARWGQLRNPNQIAGHDIVLLPNALHDAEGHPAELLHLYPTVPLCYLEENIPRGIGPTYLSKVLRFGLPQEYGAIDTRCVRIFGQGDPRAQRHNWLNTRARNDGFGWYIPRTRLLGLLLMALGQIS